MAEIITKSGGILGDLLRVVAVVLCFFAFPFGLLVGVVMFIASIFNGIKHICSQCGNLVEKTSKICPICKEQLR